MNSQLERIRAELDAARARAHEIAGTLASRPWNARPRPDEWSIAECLAHLNLTSRAFLPLLDDAIGRGRAQRPFAGAGRYRMDGFGWLVWLMTTLRVPVKTTEPFVPVGRVQRESVLEEFDLLQQQLAERVEQADGLDLNALRIVSPFDARLRYNVYSALRLITAHQRLHLRQADHAARRLPEAG